MSTPIFVLGKQRSGTTWLATALARHPQVAAVLRPGFDHVFESHFFTDLDGRYGRLATFSDYAEFASVFGASEYYRLTGLPASLLLEAWPTDYAGAFRVAMDAYASREGRSHWLEKTPGHTLLASKLARSYPDARFVAIARDPEAVVGSTLRLLDGDAPTSRASRALRVARGAVGWALHDTAVRDVGRRGATLEVIAYERLRADPRGVLERVCDALGLAFDDAVLDAGFAPNTSFDSEQGRSDALAPSERRAVRALAGTARRLPFRLLDAARGARDVLRGRRPLPPWFFAALRDRYAPDERR